MDYLYEADDANAESFEKIADVSHTAELIKAATPFFDTGTQKFLNLFASLYEVMDSVKSTRNEKGLSSLSFSFKKVDFEGLLKRIRPICTKEEQTFVDKILNIFHMKKMFEMYQTYSSMMSMFQTEPFHNSEENSAAPFVQEFYDDFDYETKSRHTTQEPVPDYVEAARIYDTNFSEDEKQPEKSKEANAGTNNQDMLAMLGEMLTPEQKKTFDTMKLFMDSGLLNS